MLDLVGALAQDQQRRVAVEALDDVLLRVAVTAVDAHRLERGLLRDLGREQLRHPRLEVGALARVLALRGIEHQQLGGAAACVAIWASFCWISWCSAIGLPNASRCWA